MVLVAASPGKNLLDLCALHTEAALKENTGESGKLGYFKAAIHGFLHHNPSNPTQLHSILNRVVDKVCIADTCPFLCFWREALQMNHNIDGYIPYTFGPQLADIYLCSLFKIQDPRQVQAIHSQQWPRMFFVANRMPHCRAHHQIGPNQSAWLLDHAVAPDGGSVVPQQLWAPQGQGDWRRYVAQATLHLPVFFFNADGGLGVPVSYAAAGQMSLHNAKAPPPLGGKTTTKIRISVCSLYAVDVRFIHSPLSSQWPGYTTSEQQIQLRDQTPDRNFISLERFVKHVGSRVRQYLIVRFIPTVAVSSEI
jgi:hypothetical protein